MDLGNMRLQEGILLEKTIPVIGVKGISKGAGTSFVVHHLDRILNERQKSRVFVSRPDRYHVMEEPEDPRDADVMVGVIDPLPSALMDGASSIDELMNCGVKTVWIVNRDNPGVNRRSMLKYLHFMPEFSQEEIPREVICRAQYNCVELGEIYQLEGIEKLAEHLKKYLSYQ